MSSELKYNNISLAVNTQPSIKLLISFCSSRSCGSNAHIFVLNDAVLTELFPIYYASRAPDIKTNHFWNHVSSANSDYFPHFLGSLCKEIKRYLNCNSEKR